MQPRHGLLGPSSLYEAVAEDTKEAWKRQIREATWWRKVGGPAEAVFCEMKDLGVAFPSWHARKFEDGSAVHMTVTFPEEF